MATIKQILGQWGETLVTKKSACPRCKRLYSLRRLPANFKCADIICDFCGYLAQVKTLNVRDVLRPPTFILGAAWEPQSARMKAGVYFPLFLVLRNAKKYAVYYLATEFQHPRIFRKRPPLSKMARRPGWQGFRYNLSMAIESGALVRIISSKTKHGLSRKVTHRQRVSRRK